MQGQFIEHIQYTENKVMLHKISLYSSVHDKYTAVTNKP